MTARRCPICKKPPDERFRPFCSKRCSQIDLGKWFGEGYKIEVHETDEEEADFPDREEDGSGSGT